MIHTKSIKYLMIHTISTDLYLYKCILHTYKDTLSRLALALVRSAKGNKFNKHRKRADSNPQPGGLQHSVLATGPVALADSNKIGLGINEMASGLLLM